MGLRVMTWNAAQDWGNRLSLLVTAIRAQAPDIVALASPKSAREVEILARELEMQSWYGEGNHRWGVGLMSRLPVESFQNHKLDLFSTLVEAEVEWEGTRVRLFATHLRGYGPQSSEHELREHEAQAVLDVMRPYADGPVLLVGDLNSASPGDEVGPPPPDGTRPQYYAARGGPPTWQWSAPHWPSARGPLRLVLGEAYVDCYRKLRPADPGFTLFSDYPWARIDYIFASPPLSARLFACDVARGDWDKEASHHFPVWAEFK